VCVCVVCVRICMCVYVHVLVFLNEISSRHTQANQNIAKSTTQKKTKKIYL